MTVAKVQAMINWWTFNGHINIDLLEKVLEAKNGKQNQS